MRIFFSAGEPSGDVHGASLIRALQLLRPDVECIGFGGDRMQAAGCRLVYPLCQLAVMFVRSVLSHVRTFAGLLQQADRCFRTDRPDAVVLIDYPGFNWWVARRAKAHGIPVIYFVPPQIWAWGGWRVHKMRRFVDHVLCTLPFEKSWYRKRGVDAHYVGHPFFDELEHQTYDSAFLHDQRSGTSQGPVIGLLPGSRNQEIRHNWSTIYRAAAHIHQARPDVRFLAACYKPHQQKVIDDYLSCHAPVPITTHVDKTPEIIELSTAIIQVSGSVALELLWRAKPAVVVYRLDRIMHTLSKFFLDIPYVSLVNLLAGKSLYPEFVSTRRDCVPIAEHVLAWLNDSGMYQQRRQELTELRAQVARPGACARAAEFIVDALAKPGVRAA